MPKLDDAAYGELAKMLRERVAAHAPDWSDGNESDPGITLIELFAFLTESLLDRQNPERARSSAARLATLAQALADGNSGASASTSASASGCALERVRYHVGQVLGVDDFVVEQDYVRQRLRRLNRALHGFGIVSGLGVSVQPDSSGTGQQVVVAPGFAIDPRGEEIEVCGPATAGLPPAGQLLNLTLRHAERPTGLQPAVGDNGLSRPNEFSRIEEGFAVRAEAVAGDAVVLARLLGVNGRWRVDETFRPARAGAREQ